MKLSNYLVIGLSAMALAVTGCDIKKPYEEISGTDMSKAKPTELTLDEDNSSETGISVYWDGTDAVRAGALSFTAQLVTTPEGAGDNYSSLSKTASCLDDAGNVNDAASFVKLTKGSQYYVRVRANYAYSVYSDWTYLERDGSKIMVSVGNGYVISDFVAPKDLVATAPTYSTMSVKWSMIAPATGYEVSYKLSDASDWTVLGETADCSYAIDKLDQLTSYDVRVRAFKYNESLEKEYTDYSEVTGIATPEKPAFNPSITTPDQLVQFFSEIAAISGAADEYTLDADLDLTGTDLVSCATFGGKLDGKGHTIKGLALNDALIETLTGTVSNITIANSKITNYLIKTVNAGATVSGVNLASTTEFTFDTNTDGANYGAVVGENAGTVTGCTTAATANVEVASFDGETNVGGIVGKSTGLVSDCSNSGDLTLSLTAPKSGKYHTLSGVVGLATGTAGQTIVKGCSNSGKISVTIATACYFNTAGVVGSTNIVKQSAATPENQGIIDGCNNTGAISMHYIAGGSGAYPMCGGVCGSIDGYVQNCWNDGALSLVCDSQTATWTCQRVGGVAATITFGAKDLTNKENGKISVSALVAGGTAGARGAGCIETSCWGGVVSNAGPYAADNTIVFDHLVNNANLDITANSTTGTPNHHIGAVVGYATAKLINCSNTGSFKFTSPVAYSRLGGIVGGTKCDVESCTNSGNLTLDMSCLPDGSSVIGTGKFAIYLGGIVGCTRLAASAVTIKNCTNSGNLTAVTDSQTATSIYNSYVAGILGCKGTTTNTDLAVLEACTNTGTLTATGSQSVIKADLCGGVYQEAK